MKIEKVEKYIGTDILLLVKFRNGLTLKGQILEIDTELNAAKFKTLAKTALIDVTYIESIEIVIENFSNMIITPGKPKEGGTNVC